MGKVNYLGLRQTDAQAALLATTIAGYERVLVITQNRYNVGVAPKTDLLQAQTQLANAQAEKLFGYPREALIGKPVEMLVPQSARGAHPGRDAVQDLAAQLQSLTVFADMWPEKDPSAMFIMHQSAPLMVPINPNATFKATVVA